ncbi:Membrane proteinase PrsW, cleaves anti-sigma factor RsiW, M82 family [Geosporobacter subterraneus DSM 17957]|uniref:Protease PrsW n=1 Tax=Geosporobacter subterraneus DSM 17957 TaxID=1121919 RepID=A0A1M6IIL8_9FIRM|nr:PrsW family glutamic-type intramembrane protease [Geosporobacter subterraneus]SHJ34322.1 Membrane proteinase PrsW, cleaves anti-sigma factor RsiW, M82 family [Geosporobacter subterraneus DSM 17957]
MTRLFMIAIAPGIALALAIYLTDRYDREPIHLLLKVFVFGCLSVIPTAIVERFLISFNIFGGVLGAAYTAFIVAGFTEEYFKRAVVLHNAYYHRAFNEKLDGIVYAVFSALGFATIENIMYVVFRFSANPQVGLFRGILSVPAHMLFGVTMGYYLSLSRFVRNEEFRSVYLRRSLIMPILLHGIFNFILMAQIPILMVLFIPFVIYLWLINLRKLDEYAEESKRTYETMNLPLYDDFDYK